MFKLTVVAGPNRGTSFPVQEGENSIGRQMGNSVVLSSAKVSKRHCVLVVNNDEVIVTDQGSANGTFVNGVLAKSKRMNPGDRISVGEYVLELTQPQSASLQSVPAVQGLGSNVLQFPVAVKAPEGAVSGDASAFPGAGSQAPKDLKGRLLWAFEHQLMPIFYRLNLKHEWRVLGVSAFAVFAVGNLLVSVYPLLEQNRENVVREIGRRATFMARQIVEHNAPYLAARAETKTEIGSIETTEGVRVSLLTDLSNRILAPSTKLNGYLTSGPEAVIATRARELFRNGRETGVIQAVDDLVVAVEPVRILSQQAGRNVTVGMAIVSIDTSLSTPDFGQMGVTYSETLILTGLLGGLLLMILYRLTLKPLTQLNEDMDKVLKGDMPQVTHEFKFEELDSLWDIINSSLQRVPKGGMQGDAFGGGGLSASASDEFGTAMRVLGQIAKFGLLVCDADRKIIYLNPIFEEISGIRAEAAMGQDVATVARDQSLAPFMNDLFDRASAGGEAVEDYDFSGISYKCHGTTLGSPARCYVVAAARVEG